MLGTTGMCNILFKHHNKFNYMIKMSVPPHDAVQKHLANNSPSKVSFRFSKSKRFKDNNSECPILFYSYRSQLSKRKPVIGSQKRLDLSHIDPQTPGSDLYNVNSYHEYTKFKGLTFGLSRQVSPDRSYLIPQIHRHPGPDAYQNQKPGRTTSSYSIRSKTIDIIDKHLSHRQSPGPGAYQAVQLDCTKQKTKVSKYQGPKLGVGLTSPRFLTIRDTPAPNSYGDLDSLSPTARYVVSQHQGRGTRPFTHERRFTHDHWKLSKNPGPTDYQKPSDFGIYAEVSHYKKLSVAD